ncbi:MAG: TonB-dependent receptor domain-containing protein, partial [Terriglobia bacterium]
MTRPLLIFFLASVLGLLPGSLAAQVSTRTLTGTVLDPNQAPVPRATLRLRDAAGTVVAETLTDTHGSFRFAGVSAQTYTLEVELTGFARAIQSVRPGEAVEIKLAVAAVRERVVVTATRTEAPTSQVGSSVTVIPAELLESRQSVTLTELLRTVPGLAPLQSGPPGAITSIFARGGESDHNKVFIDGVPVNEPGGFFNFANFTPLNLNRIEVVRGPQSALFGSDALGSTIQLFTQRGVSETLRPRMSFSLEGGKHDTFRGTTRVAGEVGWFDYSLAAARFLTDNAAANSAFRNTTLSGNLGAGLGERTSLRVILRGDFGTAGTPGPLAFQPPDDGEFFRRREGLLSTVLQNQTTAFWRQRFSYAYARSRQRSVDAMDNTTASFFDFLFDFLNDTRRQRATYQSDFTFAPTQILTFAFEYEREKGRLATVFLAFPSFSPPPVVAHRTNVGGVIQHQALLLGRLSLTGGVRIEDNGSFGTKATPRLSAAYFLRRGGPEASGFGATKLKFNFGTGIKEAQFVESFSPSPFFCGNPTLKPERVRSFDFGVEQRFARDRAKLEINWFDNRFRDLVAFGPGDPDPSDPFLCFASFFNVGRAKAKGSEVVLEVSPRHGLYLLASYTYVNSQVLQTPPSLEDDPVFGVGRPLLRRPRHAGALTVQWNWRQLNLTSTLVRVGRRVDRLRDELVPGVR